ncbi:LPXTG cell wall anchor domain-containing protein [Bifidobacterium aerophilum]|nr:LPXTG cell wall anchor domain-containing protein [Bifidobacterium aerophilum]
MDRKHRSASLRGGDRGHDVHGLASSRLHRGIAVAISLAMTLVCAIPSAYAQNGTAIGDADDANVTVVSNGHIVTDNTIVAAAQDAVKTGTDASTTTDGNQQTDAGETFGNNTVFANDATFDAGNGLTDNDANDATAARNDGSADASSEAQNNTADSKSSDKTTADQNADPQFSFEATGQADRTDSSDVEAQAETADSLGGRDFAGQVTKKINGKTYILIGNEQQLRAIGTGKKVIKPIWKIETEEYQKNGCKTALTGIPYDCWVDIPDVTTQTYAGDADLDETATLRDKDADANHNIDLIPSIGERKYHYVTIDDDGKQVSAQKNADTGLTYSSTANYIIFRDIDLSKNAADKDNTNWTPLMFSAIMLGAKSKEPQTAASLWNGIDQNGDAVTDQAVRPTISNVTVRQTGELDYSKTSGIGFFGTISNQITLLDGGKKLTSLGETVVSNIRLEHVDVANESTTPKDSTTLVSIVFGVLKGLLSGLGWLLDKITGVIPGLGLDLEGVLGGLLTLKEQDPSIFATGGFAGRLDGEVTVSGCEVADVAVSNVKGMTGGFAGYSTGQTEYELLSTVLGGLVDSLSSILNAIPGLGLGDLIHWLLNGNLITAGNLIPIGYVNPTLTNNAVTNFRKGTVIGSDTQGYAGGFIGNQIGTIIENSTVTSTNPYAVKARYYAGGFSGVTRNDTMEGALSNLGVDLIKVAQPQSLIEGSTVSADVTVNAGSYAGGFAGAMANSFAVNDSLTGVCVVKATGVTSTSSEGTEERSQGFAGGFTGAATLGWVTDLGKQDAGSTNLLKGVNKILVEALTAGKDSTALLSLVGVEPSAILGVSMNGTIAVSSDNDYAGGIVGRGDGLMLAASDEQHLDDFPFWKYGRRTVPSARNNTVTGLKSVAAQGDYAGGIAGRLGTASIGGVVNDTIGLGGYLPFEVSALSVTGAANDGLTVTASGDYASAGIGKATGGRIGKATTAYKTKDANGNEINPVPDTAAVTLDNVAAVTANNYAGGFIGVSGPGDLVGSDGLDLLGLGALKISGLLSVAQGVMVEIEAARVNGIASGMTVTAKGAYKKDDPTKYYAGGFLAQSNSTQVTDAHVANLHTVTADGTAGVAGGFVALSETGGLADVADKDSILELVKIDGGLLKAVSYLIPKYDNVDVRYVNGGSVTADIAGGFTGDFQSGTVDNTAKGEKDAWAVYNLDTVTGGAYAGGFGGKVHSGALASSDGGISVLGNIGNGALTIGAEDLASIANAYVPVITNAGVHTDAATQENTSGRTITDPDDPGLTVTATTIASTDSNSGSAGGFIGYGSGVQVSNCDLTQLRHTDVKAPQNLETTGSIDDTYLSESSKYAVTGARYAGGFIGKMDIGSAASVGGGLKILGKSIGIQNVLTVLSAVVSTIEHSDVTGGIGGYSVLASNADNKDNALGMAGGFAGQIKGGHIQDSSSHEFVYIIGQISAGGYVGTMQPGAVADILGNATILDNIVDVSNAASLVQDFVPTIRNSSTDAAICGGAVRAQGTSNGTTRRGMAGGYVGHDNGGHIWGLNDASWKNENYKDGANKGKYSGPQKVAYAARIRSVYGQEIAGGYTGLMEPGSTAEAGSIGLLKGLIRIDNLAGVLAVVYPTEQHTKVTGPLRNASIDQWNTWVNNIGKYSAYGKEFTDIAKNVKNNTITTQEQLDAYLNGYVFGFNVVAGRSSYDSGANLRDSGVAGGHVGIMITGVITDGQSEDVKTVSAMRAAGGYAGTMEAGQAAKFGSLDLLGLNVDLGKLVGVAKVFVPVVKSSSVIGYRKGMKVTATGSSVTNGTGNAGGYVGMGVGAQLWGDLDSNGADLPSGSTAADAAGVNVTNLRKVSGRNNVGGYIGLATSGATADADLNSSGFLQQLLSKLISNPTELVQVLQATIVTIRGAHVRADSNEWGYTVEGAYQDEDGATKYALNAGGFAGSLQAAILGDKDSAKSNDSAQDVDVSKDPAELVVTGLRAVEGGQYAGGFFGLADVSSVTSVGGNKVEPNQDTNLLLGLLKTNEIGVLEAFRTFVYDARVTGVADGIQVKAHDSTTSGVMDSTRFTGAAGGFGGGLINGSVKQSSVANLNSVTGVNYVGGFIGHLGKSGTVSAEKVNALGQILNVTAGVLNIWGSHVENSNVSGIGAGYTVTATHGSVEYGRGETNATGREVAGGFVGYADLARIKSSQVTGLKKVTSGELAGGFVGETKRAYLVDLEANSVLLNVLFTIVNELVKALYLPQAERLGVINLSGWFPDIFGKVFDLKVLSDGDLLYVNLLGLKISVALSKADAENQQQTDVAIITIGDSTIKLPCSKDGINDTEENRANLKVTLIKANRTEVSKSSVQGIADGYDVFGGGATQGADGSGVTGYAGGFVALNDEGLFENNDMTYADTIRGASGLVGPFSGTTLLKSVYSFNTVRGIEGTGNTYHIYRDVDPSLSHALAVKTVDQNGKPTEFKGDFTYGSHMDDQTGDNGETLDVTGKLKLHLNRYDVAHLAENAFIEKYADLQYAVIANNLGGSNTGENAAKPMNVYVSAAKAVLMLDKAVTDNNGGLTPEPDDGQDPCGLNGCQTVDLTLQKVWIDGQLTRPDSITVQVTATYTDADGNQVVKDPLPCYTDECTPEDWDNPFTVTLTAKANGSAWSDTWRTKITGLPVAFVDTSSGENVVRYYTYTVKELTMTYGESTKTPSEAGYSVSVDYGKDADGRYVAKITNSAPLPNTGGSGTQWIAMLAVIILGLGTAWYLRENRVKPASTGGAGTASPFGGRRGRHAR